MDRLACVDLPAFPLQLVRRAHPEWDGLPVAVVAEDTPQGRILWVNEAARERRILPGHRYAQALSLASELRAQVVDAQAIADGTAQVVDALREFSPEVAAADDEPGVFWLDAAGLGRLYPSLPTWGKAIARALSKRGLTCSVVVGFSRFGTYAVARARGAGVAVFDGPGVEAAATRQVPLARLDVSADLRDTLARLGVTTVGALAGLPAGGLLERFGPDAYALHQRATGAAWDPLSPRPLIEPMAARVDLEAGEADATRLVFATKRILHPLLSRLAASRRAVATLYVSLTLERGPTAGVVSSGQLLSRAQQQLPVDSTREGAKRASRIGAVDRQLPVDSTREGAKRASRIDAVDRQLPVDSTREGAKRASRIDDTTIDVIRPAEPTLDARTLLGLLHLRWESRPPPRAVIEIEIGVEDIEATREQLALFATKPRRDLAAGNEALARLRAELGNEAVVRAVLCDGHLPEARYGWEPVEAMRVPAPRELPAGERRPLCRRVFDDGGEPVVGDGRGDGDNPGDGLINVVRRARRRELSRPPGRSIAGPHVISSGWWRDADGREDHRAYHVVEDRAGRWVWVYYDRARRRWIEHGQVE